MLRIGLLIVLVTAALVGCDRRLEIESTSGEGDSVAYVSEGEVLALDLVAGDDGWHAGPQLQSANPFNRAGFRYDATPGTVLQVRTEVRGTWTLWQDATVIFAEDIAHVAFADTNEESTALEFRFNGEKNEITYVAVELIFLEENIPSPVEGFGQQTQTLVVERDDWGARPSTCFKTGLANAITVHHANSPNNDPLRPSVRMRQLQAFHIDVREQCDIAYHFVVAKDGTLFAGRNLSLSGGVGLDDNIDIAFLGEFDSEPPSARSVNEALVLIDEIQERYGIPLEQVRGHNETQAQSCPGGGMAPHLNALRSR